MYGMPVFCFHGKIEYQSYYRFDLLHSYSSFIILYYRGYISNESRKVTVNWSENINGLMENIRLRKPKGRLCILSEMLPRYSTPTKINQDEYKEIGRGCLILLSVQRIWILCWTLANVWGIFDVDNVSEDESVFVIRCKRKMILPSWPRSLTVWNVQHNIHIMNQLLSQTCETNQISLPVKRAEMIRYISSIVTISIIRIQTQCTWLNLRFSQRWLWRWRQYVLLERRWIATELDDIISQKIPVVLLWCTWGPDFKVVYDNPQIPLKWNIYFWYKCLSKRQVYKVNEKKKKNSIAPCWTSQSDLVAQLYLQICCSHLQWTPKIMLWEVINYTAEKAYIHWDVLIEVKLVLSVWVSLGWVAVLPC
jgi:hypothetical protein